MNVTITAHDVPDNDDGESHRFHFLVDDGENPMRAATVTLRTARVMVRELANYTALDQMYRALLSTPAESYDTLIGAFFSSSERS